MVEKKSRDLSYEFIRVFSMFLIILDHELSTYTSPEASKIIEPIVAVGVTLFFLLSGRFAFKLNLEDKSLYKKFYWKKILGLIIPMLVYMLIKNYHVMVYNKGLEVHPMFFLTHFGVALVNGFSYMEYWFLYTLIALLVAVPFTARMVQNMQKKDKKAFLIVGLIFGTLSTYIPLVAKVDFSVAYYFIGHCLIFYAGAFIEEFFETKKSRAVLYCAAIPCVIINTALAYFGYKSGYESTSPLFFVFTTAAFIALHELGKKLIKDPKKPFGKVIEFLGKHSLGVYMIHMIFVYHLNDMHIIPTNFLGLFISSIIITIVSVAAAFILDSTIIKFLQKLTTKIFKLEKTLNAKNS